MTINPELLRLLRNQLDGMAKTAFTPAPGIAGGDPAAAGGAPPGDPAAAGGAPPMDPAAAGGAPPGDPAAMGGMPADPAAAMGAPPGLDPMLQQAITAAVQQALQAQGGAGGGGKRSGGKGGGDETASQLYKMNTLLTAIVEGLNRSGMDIQIPPQMLLGPPPGSDPATAIAMAPQPGMAPPQGAAPAPAPAAGPAAAAPAPAPSAGEKLASLLEPAEPPIGHAVTSGYRPGLQVTAAMPIPSVLSDATGIPHAGAATTLDHLWAALNAR